MICAYGLFVNIIGMFYHVEDTHREQYGNYHQQREIDEEVFLSARFLREKIHSKASALKQVGQGKGTSDRVTIVERMRLMLHS